MTTAQNIRRARLDPGTLARFATGMTWPDLLSLGDGHSEGWWRHALPDAEERRLLVWARADGTWKLTPAGRAITRNVS